MEHTLQILITIPFVNLSAKIISKDKSTFIDDASLSVLAALVTMVRYEGLFLLFIVSALFIFRNRWRFSIILFLSGFLPIAIYGMISTSNRWFFLPNSVILKGNMPQFSLLGLHSFYQSFISKMINTPHIFNLVSAALILFSLRIYQDYTQKKWRNITIMLIIFMFTTILHMMFAGTGWFYRYEAYLVALGIFVIAINLWEYLPKNLSIESHKSFFLKYISIILLLLLLVSPLVSRATSSLRETPQATHNIYEQQYQMGLFLNQFYKGENIAVNDIGAVSYFADYQQSGFRGIRKRRRSKAKTKKTVYYSTNPGFSYKKEVKIAIVYDDWFKMCGGHPSNWIKVGEWTILNNVVCGGNIVSFYATNI
jgi:hypothetical protein